MVISADVFAVLLRYFYSSIGNFIITIVISITTIWSPDHTWKTYVCKHVLAILMETRLKSQESYLKSQGILLLEIHF